MTRLGLETRHRRSQHLRATPSRGSGSAASSLPDLRPARRPGDDPGARSARRSPAIDPDAPHPLNLFRVHWYNDATGAAARRCPSTSCCPQSLTGVDGADRRRARRPVPDDPRAQGAGGVRLPRAAHRHRAVRPDRAQGASGRPPATTAAAASRSRASWAATAWPSCPEGMSEERFRWLERWVQRPGRHHPDAGLREQREGDLRRVRRARARPAEHHLQPVLRVRELPRALHLHRPRARARRSSRCDPTRHGTALRAFVSATGSAGTLGAGDYLKERFGARIVAVEALECPTLLYNGFGEHNIQGIGDKHVPFIHNVMNTDVARRRVRRAPPTRSACCSARAAGREYLVERRRRAAPRSSRRSTSLGLSSICNVRGGHQDREVPTASGPTTSC